MFNCSQKATAGLILRSSLEYNENAMPIKLKLHVMRALCYWLGFFFLSKCGNCIWSRLVVCLHQSCFFSLVPSVPSLTCHVLILRLSSSGHQLSTTPDFSCYVFVSPLHLFALFIAGLQQNIGMSSTWQQKEGTSLQQNLCCIYLNAFSFKNLPYQN